MGGLCFLHSSQIWIAPFVLQLECQEMPGGRAISNTINRYSSHLTRRKKLGLQALQMGFSAQDVKLSVIRVRRNQRRLFHANGNQDVVKTWQMDFVLIHSLWNIYHWRYCHFPSGLVEACWEKRGEFKPFPFLNKKCGAPSNNRFLKHSASSIQKLLLNYSELCIIVNSRAVGISENTCFLFILSENSNHAREFKA